MPILDAVVQWKPNADAIQQYRDPRVYALDVDVDAVDVGVGVDFAPLNVRH